MSTMVNSSFLGSFSGSRSYDAIAEDDSEIPIVETICSVPILPVEATSLSAGGRVARTVEPKTGFTEAVVQNKPIHVSGCSVESTVLLKWK